MSNKSDLLYPPQDKALHFGGQSSIVREEAPMPAGELTIQLWLAWVKPPPSDPEFASSSTDPESAFIFSYDEWPSDGSNPDGGDPVPVQIRSATNPTLTVGTQTAAIGGSVADENWHHIAVVLSKAGSAYSAQCYFDGQPSTSGKAGDGQPIRTGRLFVLAQQYWQQADDQFCGDFADLAIWNYARSGEQIRSDMQRGVAAKAPGLVMHWRLNDSVPPDAEANSITFVPTGAPDLGFHFPPCGGGP